MFNTAVVLRQCETIIKGFLDFVFIAIIVILFNDFKIDIAICRIFESRVVIIEQMR